MISKETLKKEYEENGKTFFQIAEETGVATHNLKYWAKKWEITIRPKGRQRKVIENKKFGSLMVIKPIYSGDRLSYLCSCDCGKAVIRSATGLTTRNTHKSCWDCRNRCISNKKWKGYQEISLDFWTAVQKSAAARNLNFDLNIEEAWDLFLKQERRCALSGIELYFSRSKKRDRDRHTASLDRIDSTKGYYLSNVQWVHKTINNLKMNLTEQEFLNWCKLVTDFRNKF